MHGDQKCIHSQRQLEQLKQHISPPNNSLIHPSINQSINQSIHPSTTLLLTCARMHVAQLALTWTSGWLLIGDHKPTLVLRNASGTCSIFTLGIPYITARLVDL
jgi:hypothetical protein